jgi:translocator protein
MNTWYSTLVRPPLTPPDWIFSPAWTILYITIAISIVTYYRVPSKEHVVLTTLVLALHIASNLAWTYLFFGLQSPAAALADIALLDLSLVLIIIWFWKAHWFAGTILVPYLLWVMFATYLNYGFYRLN